MRRFNYDKDTDIYFSPELTEKLSKINPFRRWEMLSRDIKHSKKPAFTAYSDSFNNIMPHLMEYGDSVFINMTRKYWLKFKKRRAQMKPIVAQYNLKYKWFKVDPVCGLEGLRVWCFRRALKIKRPRGFFKIND